MKVYRLAEIYLPPAECLKPVLTALSAIASRGIDLAFLSHVYSLPDGLLEMPSLQNIITSCKKKLLELFADVPSVIKDPEQRKHFCALPFAAVWAWLRFKNLKVHSESCVLFLLSAWVNNKEHPVCNPHQLKQLAHRVRVGQLSPTYLHSVLPDLKWFQEICSSSGDGRFVRTLQVMSAQVGTSCLGWDGPAGWIADGRNGTAMPSSVSLEWNLGAEDIISIDESPLNCNKICPVKAYFDGIFYELLVKKVAKAKGDSAVTLGVFLRVASDSMSQVLNSWDPDGQPCVLRTELWASNKMRELHGVLGQAGLGRGYSDLLDRSGATIAEVVTPFLNEGKLNLKAIIKA